MTDIEEALGEESTLEIGVKSYRIGPTTVEIVRQWEQWMRQDTLATMIQAAMPLGSDMMNRAFDSVARLAADGAFNFFGGASLARMNTIEGKTKLLFWRLQPNHPEIDEKTVRGWVENEAVKIGLALREKPVPNSEAPSTGATSTATESLGSRSLPESSKIPDGISTESASAA